MYLTFRNANLVCIMGKISLTKEIFSFTLKVIQLETFFQYTRVTILPHYTRPGPKGKIVKLIIDP